MSLFVRDRVTGRLAFNSKAIEALGLSADELAKRGYPVDRENRDRKIQPPPDPATTETTEPPYGAALILGQRDTEQKCGEGR